jgi:hypothetical protein
MGRAYAALFFWNRPFFQNARMILGIRANRPLRSHFVVHVHAESGRGLLHALLAQKFMQSIAFFD